MDAAKKNFRRFQQRANQNLGLSEKTDVIGADVHKVEEKVETFIEVLVRLKQKYVECLRSKSKEENVEKRRKKLNEFVLGTTFVNDAKFMEEASFDGLFSDLLKLFGASLLNVSDEIAQSEFNIEKRVFEPLSKLADDHKNVLQLKEKLKNAVLDMDSARSRLNNAPSEKIDQLQVELDSAWNKVDNSKDNWMTEMYSLAAKELDVANLILLSAKIQLEFFKSACHNLEAVLPAMQEKVDQYSKRPVFGCPLSDHLRYSRREISVVLEVCCSALLELGVKEEGLFRLSGSAAKIKKLKAMFDIDELDLSDWDTLPHSIAGTLKLYLRELPEPLMTYHLYNEWIKAAEEKETESRLKNLKYVCERLPETNFKNIRYLFRFLAKVVENQQFTKMNFHNLAIVMAPNLLRSPCTSVDEGFRDNAAITNVVDCLISNVDYFFPGG
uniref:Rho-GAP domain-containing protein n=1 Tax=Romanomermis culicivorax TaxID=13658 RepID=A0A915KBT1_ROMCU